MNDDTFSKDTTKRAAIYCRVSTADQSCERQVRDLLAYAQRLGCEVTSIYKETASGANNARKCRAEILAQAQARQIDYVLVTELTRWGRSTPDLLSTIEQLAAHKVSLMPLTGISFDLNTPQGKLLLSLLSSISQFERDLLIERTNSGIAAAKAKGTVFGRPKGNKTLDKHREAVHELKKHGFSIRDIASKLKIGKDTVSTLIKELNA